MDDVLRILSAEFEDEEPTPEAATEEDAEGVADEQEADPEAADDEKMND